MKAILLAGGLGAPLREEPEFLPEPMVEICGRPILWHIISNLACFGIIDFIIATGHKSDMIRDYFLKYEAWNNDFTVELGRRDSLKFYETHGEAPWKVTAAFSRENTMMGGRVFRASEYLDDEPFLVTYGGGLADISIRAFNNSHAESGFLAAVTTVKPISRFGVMEPGVLQYLSADCVLEDDPFANWHLMETSRHTGTMDFGNRWTLTGKQSCSMSFGTRE